MLRRFIGYFRITVTVGSVVVLMLLGWPLADEYLTRRASVGHLESLRQEFEQLTGRETQIAQLNESLAKTLNNLNCNSLTPNTETAIREELVEIVREHGCRVRQINVNELPARPWLGISDDPMEETSDGLEIEQCEYLLCSSRISLTLSGSMDAIMQVVGEIEQRNFLAIMENLSVQPTDVTGEILQMELRMRFFGLVPNDRQSSDPMLEELVAGT